MKNIGKKPMPAVCGRAGGVAWAPEADVSAPSLPGPRLPAGGPFFFPAGRSPRSVLARRFRWRTDPGWTVTENVDEGVDAEHHEGADPEQDVEGVMPQLVAPPQEDLVPALPDRGDGHDNETGPDETAGGRPGPASRALPSLRRGQAVASP